MWKRILVLSTLLICDVYSYLAGECVCVPYYQCGRNRIVITQGEWLTDGRSGNIDYSEINKDDGSGTDRVQDVCNNCECESFSVCCFHSKDDLEIPEEATGCGYINPGGLDRAVVANNESHFGEFPSMVQIFEDRKYTCAGTLIHPSVVLTAAHCVSYSRKNHYLIRAGEWDTSNANELLAHQDRLVSTIKRHEEFKAGSYHNDIALVFLNQPFRLQPHINLACLATKVVPKNTRCFTIGWGIYPERIKKNSSVILSKIEVTLFDRADCLNALRKTRLGSYFSLHSSFICAGDNEDKVTSFGEGGGPLFCSIDGQEDRYQQVGIVSWGINFGDSGVPEVYTNVAQMRRWIDREMSGSNYDTNVYEYNNSI